MYYAYTNKYYASDVHVFAAKADRDSWVDLDYETRVPISAKDARRNVNFERRAYTHGDAYIPTSWRRKGYWEVAETDTPNVYETYDVVKRYHH